MLVAIHAVLNKPNLVTGIQPGRRLPPFAVPLAVGDLRGDADVATRADDGAAGRVPACTVRGPQLLNVCQLYERGPVVLVLFVDGGSCPEILSDLQALAPSFPGVQFAAVAIKGDRASAAPAGAIAPSDHARRASTATARWRRSTRWRAVRR